VGFIIFFWFFFLTPKSWNLEFLTCDFYLTLRNWVIFTEKKAFIDLDISSTEVVLLYSNVGRKKVKDTFFSLLEGHVSVYCSVNLHNLNIFIYFALKMTSSTAIVLLLTKQIYNNHISVQVRHGPESFGVLLRGKGTNCSIAFEPGLCALCRSQWVMNTLKKVRAASLLLRRYCIFTVLVKNECCGPPSGVPEKLIVEFRPETFHTDRP